MNMYHRLPVLPPGYLIRKACSMDQKALDWLLLIKSVRIFLVFTLFMTIAEFGLFSILGSIELAIQIVITTLVVFFLIVVPIGLALYSLTSFTRKNFWVYEWVVDYNGHLVAHASLFRHNHYSLLISIYVIPMHRRRNLASCLLLRLAQKEAKPLYVVNYPFWLKRFYTRVGFVPVSQRDLPRDLRFHQGVLALF